MADTPRDWRVPAWRNLRGEAPTADSVCGWFREALQTGQAYLERQRAWRDSARMFDLVAGLDEDPVPAALSDVKYNRIRRNLREQVATLANLRPTWGYKTDNHLWDEHALLLGKGFSSWWGMTSAGRSIKSALQWAAVCGRGYLSPVWQRDYWSLGKGDVALKVYGPRDVLFVQLPQDHNLQRAYVVIVREPTPIALACDLWPDFADVLEPSRSVPSDLRKGQGRASRLVNAAMNVLFPGGTNPAREEVSWPEVDILTAWVLDTSVNLTDREVRMGEPGSTWEYVVPPLGSEVPSGLSEPDGIDFLTGQPKFRQVMTKVDREGARLFPLRRKIQVACGPGGEPLHLLRDGSATDWDGRVPLVPFDLDPWPWETLPFGLAHDAWTLQRSDDRLLRAVDDCAGARLRPKMQYDENRIDKSVMDEVDFRSPDGLNVPTDFSMGDVVKPLLDPRMLSVEPWIPEFIRANESRIDHVMGVSDLAALAKARQVPSGDALEKLKELAGPLLGDMSESVEASLVPLGEMWKSRYFQYVTLTRRMQLLGPDGAVEEDWDYDPANMVPSHMPGESTQRPSAVPLWQRARAHMGNLRFHVTPRSAHQITQLAFQLKLLQLQKTGFPVDPQTVAEAFDVPNWGTLPPTFLDVQTGKLREPRTVLEKWIVWQQFMLTMKQAMGGAEGQGKGGGRPTADRKSPTLVQKDQGTRTTMKTT